MVFLIYLKELPFGVLSILYIEENAQGERLKTRGEKTRAKKARLNELDIKNELGIRK